MGGAGRGQGRDSCRDGVCKRAFRHCWREGVKSPAGKGPTYCVLEAGNGMEEEEGLICYQKRTRGLQTKEVSPKRIAMRV